MKNSLFIGLLALSTILVSCGSDPLDVDVSATKLEIDYLNMDSLLYKTPDSKRAAALDQLEPQYATIIEYQNFYCFKVGMNPEITLDQDLSEFYKNTYLQRLEKGIKRKFPNPKTNHEKIIEGFKHLKYHLPKAKMPKAIVYTNSYFSASAFCTEDMIAMGMERYLGSKTDVIKELPNAQFPQYIKEAMEPQFLERDAVCAWIFTHLIEEKEDAYTIEAIVNWGKILYLTEAAYPDMADATILRYNQKDYNWALKNERAFWDYLIQQKLLYSKDSQVKQNLLHEAPFTAGIQNAQNSPDRLGQFLGWRIIHSYMEQYDITLQELINKPYTTLIQEYEINE
jgi:hypothetical protein